MGTEDAFALELSYTDALEIMGGTEKYDAIPGVLSMENGELVLCTTRPQDEPIQ